MEVQVYWHLIAAMVNSDADTNQKNNGDTVSSGPSAFLLTVGYHRPLPQWLPCSILSPRKIGCNTVVKKILSGTVVNFICFIVPKQSMKNMKVLCSLVMETSVICQGMYCCVRPLPKMILHTKQSHFSLKLYLFITFYLLIN